MTISGNSNNIGQILYASYRACDQLGYSHQELLKSNISFLMPEYIRSRHDQVLLDYFKKNKISKGTSDTMMIWPLDSQGYLRIGQAQIKVLPFVDKGIVLFSVLWLLDVKTMI